jgi:carboxypeptidase C (cathepsin A)
MRRSFAIVAAACLWVTAGTLVLAQQPAAEGGDNAEPPKNAKEEPKPELSVTQHSVSIGGKTIAYTATAGTLVLRDQKDEPAAQFGFTAYVKKGVNDPRTRPLTFAYNGGPGSSSIWLHMGVLGPRRVAASDLEVTPPPPYALVDNAWSILDVTDLVMIDPVGTGYSHAIGKKENKDFWGTDSDITSVSQFIVQYVSDNGRWNSPKFLLGESYGTTRSAGVVAQLWNERGMAMNGVILVSVALDIEAIFEWPGNDRPYPLFLPTFAATAWYHKALPEQPAALEPFLTEVREWAIGPYASALAKGDALTDAERDAVAAKLHRYTGLAEDYIRQADLRITTAQFNQELLRGKRETVSRLDSRFTGFTFDRLAKEAEYDPQQAAIAAAYTAAFLDYYHRELGARRDRTYHVFADVFTSWDFKHRIPGFPFPLPMVNTGPDLAQAIGLNPHLRVLVLNGYYDVATPFFASEVMFSQLRLTKEQRARVETKYYEAGHMMYLHQPSLEQMKKDLAAFITAHSGG